MSEQIFFLNNVSLSSTFSGSLSITARFVIDKDYPHRIIIRNLSTTLSKYSWDTKQMPWAFLLSFSNKKDRSDYTTTSPSGIVTQSSSMNSIAHSPTNPNSTSGQITSVLINNTQQYLVLSNDSSVSTRSDVLQVLRFIYDDTSNNKGSWVNNTLTYTESNDIVINLSNNVDVTKPFYVTYTSFYRRNNDGVQNNQWYGWYISEIKTCVYDLNGGSWVSQMGDMLDYTLYSPSVGFTIPNQGFLEKFYTITYNTHGGTPSQNPTTLRTQVDYFLDDDNNHLSPGSTFTGETSKITAHWESRSLSSLPTVSKNGNTFRGWYTQATGGTQVTTSTLFSTNSTIHAQYTPNTYSVTYEKDGGTIQNESNYTSYTYGSGFVLPIPTKAGYNFTGWYTDQSMTTTATRISNTDYGNKTFYAGWNVQPPQGSYVWVYHTGQGWTRTAKIRMYNSLSGQWVDIQNNPKTRNNGSWQ